MHCFSVGAFPLIRGNDILWKRGSICAIVTPVGSLTMFRGFAIPLSRMRITMETRVARFLRISIVVAVVFALAATGLMSCNPKGGVLSEIVITPSAPSVARGYSLQLAAQGVLTDGLTYYMTSLTWASSDTSIATVDDNGLVTAGTATGIVTITAMENDSHQNITGTVQLDVGTIQSIAVTPANPGMAISTAYQFYAVATLLSSDETYTTTQDLTSCATSSLTWTTSSADYATVASTPGVAGSGIVTALTITGLDVTYITATDIISNISWSTPLTITDTALSSIAVTITDTTVTSLTAGLEQQLTATATYGDATTLDRTTSMTWTSSDDTLATMSTVTIGLVTAGTTTGTTVTITATDPITGIAGTLDLTIN